MVVDSFIFILYASAIVPNRSWGDEDSPSPSYVMAGVKGKATRDAANKFQFTTGKMIEYLRMNGTIPPASRGQ